MQIRRRTNTDSAAKVFVPHFIAKKEDASSLVQKIPGYALTLQTAKETFEKLKTDLGATGSNLQVEDSRKAIDILKNELQEIGIFLNPEQYKSILSDLVEPGEVTSKSLVVDFQ